MGLETYVCGPKGSKACKRKQPNPKGMASRMHTYQRKPGACARSWAACSSARGWGQGLGLALQDEVQWQMLARCQSGKHGKQLWLSLDTCIPPSTCSHASPPSSSPPPPHLPSSSPSSSSSVKSGSVQTGIGWRGSHFRGTQACAQNKLKPLAQPRYSTCAPRPLQLLTGLSFTSTAEHKRQ